MDEFFHSQNIVFPKESKCQFMNKNGKDADKNELIKFLF